MTIKAVILDIGGVLEVNPRTGWPERWAHRLGIGVEEFGRRISEIWPAGATGACSLEELERRTADALKLTGNDLGALMNDSWSEYVGTLNHELADYFRGLRPRYRTGILSNSSVGAREREEEAHKFAEMCDVIVYSHEQGYLKPDARIYHDVCRQLEVVPADAVLLDDVQENVDGAIAVGMKALRFADNAQAISELNALLSQAT